ncbi:hypothetical protein EHS25_001658 [Saitozyma podzolica]|uniref:Uncharacterized protein n=1 Tax=Saitozyma podzolica TaxID=1890683 RepID=A0A427YHB1_9TREE|nr:hypothetical protein EHS25_001658 [Saitozyma podzolica]
MAGRLEGKICLITGAAGRIGRALVDGFVEAGATVIAADLVKLEHEGVDAVVCDQGDVESIAKLEEYIKAKYGRVDCLVNNGALGGNRCNVHEKPLQEYEDVMRVNVRGPLLLTQSVLRLHLAEPTRPLSIINMASIAGRRAVSLGSVYSMSKHALLGLTKSVAREYADKNVRCNAISPGVMEVPNMQGFDEESLSKLMSTVPVGRGGKPLEVAHLAVFLASDEASFITGSDYLIDGGSSA